MYSIECIMFTPSNLARFHPVLAAEPLGVPKSNLPRELLGAGGHSLWLRGVLLFIRERKRGVGSECWYVWVW